MTRFAFAALALAGLGACMDTGMPSNTATSPSFVGVSTPIETARALGNFRAVCMNNGSNLGAARGVLAQLPVILNSEQDIYYSTENLISYKITPVSRSESVCSMVWDPVESNARSIAALERIAPNAVTRDNNDGTITAFYYGAP